MNACFTAELDVLDLSVGPAQVPIRVHLPAEPSGVGVLWLHGGGFVGGSYDDPEGDGVARSLAQDGSIVVTAEYRHADPEHGVHYPTPSDDVLAAWTWFVDNAASYGADGLLHLGGASAGGNLALGAALRARDAGVDLPASLMLAYPTLHASQREPSDELAGLLRALAPEQRWSAEIVHDMYRAYVGSALSDPPTPAVPGTADPLGLPPILIVASRIDGLRASAEEYAQMLARIGHPHEYVIEEGALHGQLNTPEAVQCSRTLERLRAWVGHVRGFASHVRQQPTVTTTPSGGGQRVGGAETRPESASDANDRHDASTMRRMISSSTA